MNEMRVLFIAQVYAFSSFSPIFALGPHLLKFETNEINVISISLKSSRLEARNNAR